MLYIFFILVVGMTTLYKHDYNCIIFEIKKIHFCDM